MKGMLLLLQEVKETLTGWGVPDSWQALVS